MNPLRVLLLGVLGFACGCIVASTCPPDWHPYKESCYLILRDRKNWFEANRACGSAESRASLAVPNSQSEQDYVFELFNELHPNPTYHLWIGCNDIEEEGNWQYCPLKGVTDSYENWGNDQPDSLDDNLRDCAVMWHKNSLWHNRHCLDDINYAVCEFAVSDTLESCKQTGPDDRLTPQCLLYHAMKELSDGNSCRSHPRCHSF